MIWRPWEIQVVIGTSNVATFPVDEHSKARLLSRHKNRVPEMVNRTCITD